MPEDVARAVPFEEADPTTGTLLTTPHGLVRILPEGGEVPSGTDVIISVPETGVQVTFQPTKGAGGAATRLAGTYAFEGNAFEPIHESPTRLAAVVNLEASRSLTMGPESERILVALRGSGLAFLENGDAIHVKPGMVTVVPAGDPARAWARGPEDLLFIVVQPAGEAPAERRTLAGEIRKRLGDTSGE